MARSIPARARARTSSSAPGGGDPVAEASASGRLEPPQLDRVELGVAAASEDQRQGDGAVEQVGAARLAGALGRPADVEDVVEQLEGEADLAPEAGQLLRAGRARGEPTRPGRPPRTGARSSASSARR